MFRSSLCLFLLLSASLAVAQSEPANPSAQKSVVPVISGDLGDCTANFLVTDVQQKPIYNAKISVEIKYGFGGWHHTTLEIYTNNDGKARFEGLPRKSRGPLAFTADYKDRQTTVMDEPRDTCHGSFTAILPNETVSEIVGDSSNDE